MTWPFGRKPKRKENARFRNRKRESVLAVEVPLSRKEIRMRREARTKSLVRWSLVGCAAVITGLYVRSVWRSSLQSNPQFAVSHFEFQTNGGISAKEAAATAGLRTDMNVMDVDLTQVRERLLALPRVKAVNVTRRLPDQLAIEMEERLPVAWLTSVAHGIDQKSRLFVDRDGVAIKCDEVLREYLTLPVINAADQPVITLGREVASPALKEALALLEQIRTRDWSVPCSVSRIDIPNSWTLTAEMESGAIFTFRPGDLDRQMDRLEFILAKTRSAGRSVASINLQMQRNVPVRFFDEAAPVAEVVPETAGASTAAPAAGSRNVGYTPAAAPAPRGSARPAAPARPAKSSTAPPRREDDDIQSILRGI